MSSCVAQADLSSSCLSPPVRAQHPASILILNGVGLKTGSCYIAQANFKLQTPLPTKASLVPGLQASTIGPGLPSVLKSH